MNRALEQILEYTEISQSQMARDLGYTRQYVSALLRGDSPCGVGPAQRIASRYKDAMKSLELTPWDLIQGKKKRTRRAG